MNGYIPSNTRNSRRDSFINYSQYYYASYYTVASPIIPACLNQRYSYEPYKPELYPEPLSLVIAQISYYFSINNLLKDYYLRKQMNSQGYVPIGIVSQFKRLQTLSGGNNELILEALDKCEKELNIIDINGSKVRVRNFWAQWVLPYEQRDEHGKDEFVQETVNDETKDNLDINASANNETNNETNNKEKKQQNNFKEGIDSK
ncbi:La RNA-binding domain-containing protein [Ascoidea rubescens DSM 1968]|uniref:Winged helix DNA-binding domain-containing protein n=1 Tax=Ascoidea rubescens DSM 1968 TaxID=1344418 RepID=A0A1D2VBW3_9ASCO|nr:winged helix DNA-binding domain-containing protein [Ascoidea rubescens DSM 1968]ODV58973.1 winged helix DNA-binding domain-containing protein [Ascoidea rubescens DSM 1968]